MAKYRHALPRRNGGIFLTDGGMETTLIFQVNRTAAFRCLRAARQR
jgi:hypothetical protein